MKTASREIYVPRYGGGCPQNTRCLSSKVRVFELRHQFMLIRMFKIVVTVDAYRYGVEVRTQC